MSNPLPKKTESGFTLIEVLVALVVLSMGLLGVAAMQITSLRTNTSAAQRSQATFLAYDIADRMRANRKAAEEGAYNVSFDSDGDKAADEIAKKDLSEWKQRIRVTFPATDNDTPASAEIAQIEGSRERFIVRIRWNDDRGEGDALIFSTTVQI